MFIARCGVQWKVYLPGLTPPNEIVYSSFGFMSIGLDKSAILLSMLASSWAFASAGMVSASNAMLCGPPVTFTNFSASPDLMVTSAGSKRYPLSSPIILISWVAPVAATLGTVLVGAAAPGAAAAGAAPAGGAAFVVSAAFSPPPPHAPSTAAPAKSASP